ncbi:MAG: GreA/GreB family elongation factor [Candidatus Baltobacteraceae bacterium]
MSRAFVKENDDEPEAAVIRPRREYPYYVTPAGLDALRERWQAASASHNAREAKELQQLLDAAEVIDPASQHRKTVEFGATVTIELPDKRVQRYCIVGEDEADPFAGTISWLSPLAQALWERRAGARVLWERPAGNVNVRLISVEYQ